MSGRVGFKPPTPSGPPPNGNSISTGRSMLSGRVGFKPPTPSGEPPQSAKIMSGRRGAMSGRRGAMSGRRGGMSGRRGGGIGSSRRGGFKPPTPQGEPPSFAKVSGRKGRPPKLSIDTSGEEKPQVVPPASPVTISPKYKDAAAAQAARHRASIGLGALEKRTPAQLGFLSVLGGGGSKVLTPKSKSEKNDDKTLEDAGAYGGSVSIEDSNSNDDANGPGLVPKLDLGKLLKS